MYNIYTHTHYVHIAKHGACNIQPDCHCNPFHERTHVVILWVAESLTATSRKERLISVSGMRHRQPNRRTWNVFQKDTNSLVNLASPLAGHALNTEVDPAVLILLIYLDHQLSGTNVHRFLPDSCTKMHAWTAPQFNHSTGTYNQCCAVQWSPVKYSQTVHVFFLSPPVFR